MSQNESSTEYSFVSSAFIRGLFGDALKKQAIAQKPAQEFLEKNKRMFDRIAEATKAIEEMRKKTQGVLAKQNLEIIQKEITATVREEIISTEVKAVHLSAESMVCIADQVASKIIEKQNALFASGKSKMSTLFALPIIPLPENSRWENVTIAFENSQEVEVRYKDAYISTYDYEKLGFARMNTQDKAPDVKWELLQKLAVIIEYKNRTSVFPTKRKLMGLLDVKSENGIEKRRSDLAKQLRRVFGINDNPFLPYNEREGYCPKFNLLPESELRDSGELHTSGVSFDDDTYMER